jgi:hypothetical protein
VLEIRHERVTGTRYVGRVKRPRRKSPRTSFGSQILGAPQCARSAGSFPPFAAIFAIICLCSQIFIDAESLVSPAVTLDPNLSWPMCSGAAHPCRRHDRAGSVAPTPPPNGPGTASPSAGDAGGYGAAVVTTPIEACESNDADPPAWRAHILAKPRDRPENRHDEWPPWNWTPRQQTIAEVA